MKHFAFLLVGSAALMLFTSCVSTLDVQRDETLDGYPRNHDVDVLHYRFELELNDDSDVISGETTLRVAFKKDGVRELELDLVNEGTTGTGMVVSSAYETAGGKIDVLHEDDRLRLRFSKASRAGEERSFTVKYAGIPEQGLVISRNRHDERTFFGDNFPNRFRHWLPGIDHPYDKATCEFLVTVPEHYQVIANGLQVEESSLEGGRRFFHWRQSVPLSTYLMVIGVARFAVQELGEYEGIPVQTWVFAKDRDAGFHDFGRTMRVLAFFDAHFGPFPYEKLANVQSKTQWGGMENATAIFYYEGSVDGERSIEGTVVHEIVHQWFGDSVTESDWNHVWLSEGFATYFTHVFHEFTYGRDRMAQDLQRDRARVVQYFHEHPDDAIVDPDITIDGILSANTYQKASWVLHMLRRHVGDEAFWDSIRGYYERYRDANALTSDLRRVFEQHSRHDLEAFFRQWIHTPGHPQLRGHWTFDAAAKELVVSLEQTQKGLVFAFPIDLGIETAGGRSVVTRNLDERAHSFRIPVDAEPSDVVLDPDTWLLMEADFRRK